MTSAIKKVTCAAGLLAISTSVSPLAYSDNMSDLIESINLGPVCYVFDDPDIEDGRVVVIGKTNTWACLI